MSKLTSYLTAAFQRGGSELAGVLGTAFETRVEPSAPPGETEAGGAQALVVTGALSGAAGGPVAFVMAAGDAARLAGQIRHLSEEEMKKRAGVAPTKEDLAAVAGALARLGAVATTVASEELGSEVRWPAEAAALSPSLATEGVEKALAAAGVGAGPFGVRVHFAEPVSVGFWVGLPSGVAEKLGRLGEKPSPQRPAAPEGPAASGGQMELARLRPVAVPVRVVVARRSMSLRQLMGLAPGRVVDLEKHCDEPLELWTGPKLIGRGEAMVVGDHFGFRLTDLAGGESGEKRPSRVIRS